MPAQELYIITSPKCIHIDVLDNSVFTDNDKMPSNKMWHHQNYSGSNRSIASLCSRAGTRVGWGRLVLVCVKPNTREQLEDAPASASTQLLYLADFQAPSQVTLKKSSCGWGGQAKGSSSMSHLLLWWPPVVWGGAVSAKQATSAWNTICKACWGGRPQRPLGIVVGVFCSISGGTGSAINARDGFPHCRPTSNTDPNLLSCFFLQMTSEHSMVPRGH